MLFTSGELFMIVRMRDAGRLQAPLFSLLGTPFILEIMCKKTSNVYEFTWKSVFALH